MMHLADAILLEVGHWQWLRMNLPRLRRAGYTHPPDRGDFLIDMGYRTGLIIPASGSIAFNAYNRRDVLVKYLTRRLTARRLALPEGYDLIERKVERWNSDFIKRI